MEEEAIMTEEIIMKEFTLIFDNKGVVERVECDKWMTQEIKTSEGNIPIVMMLHEDTDSIHAKKMSDVTDMFHNTGGIAFFEYMFGQMVDDMTGDKNDTLGIYG